ncbi:MAG: orotate phosphoribosyltransferase [Rhodothermales bacterium]
MAESSPSLNRRIAADLLSIGAVSLAPDAPFIWASGLKSPIYCDNRLTMSYPQVRRVLTEGFATVLHQHGIEPDAIVGTATAGIPHAAWLAHHLGVPMAYARSRPKTHGRGNQIEGLLMRGQQVVVVEDLVSTGTSSMAVVEAVQQAGIEVAALVAIFSYGLPDAGARFEDAGLSFYTLTTFDTLLAVAAEQGHLAPEAIDSLKAWQRDPAGWSKAHQE